MTDGQPPGCEQHPDNELGCAVCTLLRLEYYTEPTSWYRQRADNPPTDEELDDWVKGLGEADRL